LEVERANDRAILVAQRELDHAIGKAMVIRSRQARRIAELLRVRQQVIEAEGVREAPARARARRRRIIGDRDARVRHIGRNLHHAAGEAHRRVRRHRRVQRIPQIRDRRAERRHVRLVVEDLAIVEVDPEVADHIAFIVDDADVRNAGEVQQVGFEQARIASGHRRRRRHRAGCVVRSVQRFSRPRRELAERQLEVHDFLVARPQQSLKLAALQVRLERCLGR
jgi:hypothetical protein